MKLNEAGILGSGKMPLDCAKILLARGKKINFILETEKIVFSSLKYFCDKNRINYRNTSNKETTEYLRSLDRALVLFSINNNYIFPPDIVRQKKFRIINFHNSVLPSYKGHGQIIPSWVIYNGEKKHGVTWHLVDEDIDTGNILCQDEFDLIDRETAITLSLRCIECGITIFRENLDIFFDLKKHGIPQTDKEDCIYISPQKYKVYRKSDIPNAGYMDISWDYSHCSRFLRSLDYHPFAVLPFPKIILKNVEYMIIRYYIESKGCEDKGSKLIKRGSEENIAEFIIEYDEGYIRLYLSKVEKGG